jgi:hypothetical protein
MPGLDPGIQAAPSLVVRERRRWVHGSIPGSSPGTCMTQLKAGRQIEERVSMR